MAWPLPALVLAVACLAVAGCSGPAPARPAAPVASSASVPAAPASLGAAPVVHTLSWTGQIPDGAWGCAPVAGCHAYPAAAYGVDDSDDLPAGTVVNGSLTLTWTAATPATATLHLGVLLANGTNETHVAPDAGSASPLVFPIPAGTAIASGTRLHLWVYGPYEEAGPVVAGWSADQAFTLAGSLTVAPG